MVYIIKWLYNQVVQNLVHHCETESLVPIARTACQFMEEVTLSVVTKESSHNYKALDIGKEKIQLPGASFLTITFDSKYVNISYKFSYHEAF